MSTLKVGGIRGVSASSDAITVANDGTCTANITSNGGSQISNRNVIINGSMIVDQRNGGSSITPADTNYTCDRWRYTASQASKFNVQQLSTSPPTGFLNYLKFTVASAVTVGTNDYFAIEQRIEGQNVTNRFGLGTANAKILKLSFHVKSSLTGTFGGAIRGAGFSRTHPFSYAISSADTWEKKTITIAADTGGSYSTNNTTALGVLFSLGAGSGKSGTAGAWTASDLFSATSAVSVVGTGSATFEITGVQLEEVVATDFEHRSFGQELALCQRYFFKTGDIGTNNEWFPGVATNASHGNFTTQGMDGLQDRSAPSLRFPCYMRAAGTVVFYPGRSGTANTANNINPFVSNTLVTTTDKPTASVGGLEYYFQGTSTDSEAYVFQCTVDSEL